MFFASLQHHGIVLVCNDLCVCVFMYCMYIDIWKINLHTHLYALAICGTAPKHPNFPICTCFINPTVQSLGYLCPKIRVHH